MNKNKTQVDKQIPVFCPSIRRAVRIIECNSVYSLDRSCLACIVRDMTSFIIDSQLGECIVNPEDNFLTNTVNERREIPTLDIQIG